MVPVTPGKHRVRVFRPGFKEQQLTVDAHAGKVESLVFELPRSAR